MIHVCPINSYKNYAVRFDLRNSLPHTQPHSIFRKYPLRVSQIGCLKHQFKMTQSVHIVNYYYHDYHYFLCFFYYDVMKLN